MERKGSVMWESGENQSKRDLETGRHGIYSTGRHMDLTVEGTLEEL